MLTTPITVDSSDPASAHDCREVEAPPIEIEFEGFSVRITPENYMRRLPLRPGVSVSSPTGVSYQNIDNNTGTKLETARKPANTSYENFELRKQELVSLLQKNVEV